MSAVAAMPDGHDGRIENVQILRFFAAAVVLLTHISFYVSARIDPAFGIWHPGAAGVSLFFVISGVVIYLSGAELPRTGPGATDFMRKRVLRIFPLYWLITTFKLVLALALPAALVGNQPTLGYTLASYFLVPMTNAFGNVEPLHGVGWSLLHEMYFYYLFAAALLLRASPFAVCSAVIVGLWLVGLALPTDFAMVRVAVSEQNLLFIAGMTLAYLYRRGLRLPQVLAWVLFIGGLLLMLSDSARNLWFPLFKRFDIGAVMIMLGAMSMRMNVFPRMRQMLARLGDSSYALYLIHPILAPALCLVMWKLHVTSVPLIIVATALISIVAGHLVFLFVETPLNGRARRLWQASKPLSQTA
ncbi:acyltransferase family protein [Massilia sp. TSP1-1-2]|uniref:acyltransferase family protein n=1 Tax=Massilia sp. TSP1-1-2 TaxID=2804649 RepID=UPI003CF1520B